MAWNGLYYEGALAVRDALMINKHLVEIDISNNRINWEGALFLAEMLEKNCYLEVLKVKNTSRIMVKLSPLFTRANNMKRNHRLKVHVCQFCAWLATHVINKLDINSPFNIESFGICSSAGSIDVLFLIADFS